MTETVAAEELRPLIERVERLKDHAGARHGVEWSEPKEQGE